MIKIQIQGMVIEIPNEVGVINGLMGAVTTVSQGIKHENVPVEEADTAVDEGADADELAAKREADAKAQAKSDAAKKAAATKKANEEKAKAEAEEKAKAIAAEKAALEDDSAAEVALTKEDIKAAMAGLIDAGISIKPILENFKAANISSLNPADYPAVIEAVKAAKEAQ